MNYYLLNVELWRFGSEYFLTSVTADLCHRLHVAAACLTGRSQHSHPPDCTWRSYVICHLEVFDQISRVWDTWKLHPRVKVSNLSDLVCCFSATRASVKHQEIRPHLSTGGGKKSSWKPPVFRKTSPRPQHPDCGVSEGAGRGSALEVTVKMWTQTLHRICPDTLSVVLLKWNPE